MLSAFDLLPLAVRVAGASLPSDRPFDGLDPTPVLRGGKSRHQALCFEFQRHQAIRRGRWKLVRPDKGGAWQLYDLGRDEGESIDLAGRRPAVARDLAARFERWRGQVEGARN
jgi:arylsulfatase/uncharacterized sulfatase